MRKSITLCDNLFTALTHLPALDEAPVVLCLVRRRPGLEAAQQVGLAGARQHGHYLGNYNHILKH